MVEYQGMVYYAFFILRTFLNLFLILKPENILWVLILFLDTKSCEANDGFALRFYKYIQHYTVANSTLKLKLF